jgi:hypothetical protein
MARSRAAEPAPPGLDATSIMQCANMRGRWTMEHQIYLGRKQQVSPIPDLLYFGAKPD